MVNRSKALLFIGLFITQILTSCTSMMYHKPEFRGKIIDSETKEPIEAAVVAVYYQKSTIGGIEPIIHFAETLTDSNGEFVIPPFKTIIHPLAHESRAYFIIYKPGYVLVSNIDPEVLFSPEKSGQTGTIKPYGETEQFTYGVAELRILKSRDERIRAIPNRPARCGEKEFPLLYSLINEERRRFGLGEVR
jgi:hypothetical protein